MPRQKSGTADPAVQERAASGLRTLLADLLGTEDLALPRAIDTLTVYTAIVRHLHDRQPALVRQARADGASWATVGKAIGSDGPAAYRRFGDLAGDVDTTAGTPTPERETR